MNPLEIDVSGYLGPDEVLLSPKFLEPDSNRPYFGYGLHVIKDNSENEGNSVFLSMDIGGAVEPVTITGDIELNITPLEGSGMVIVHRIVDTKAEVLQIDLDTKTTDSAFRLQKGDTYYYLNTGDTHFILRDDCTPKFEDSDESALFEKIDPQTLDEEVDSTFTWKFWEPLSRSYPSYDSQQRHSTKNLTVPI